MARSSLIQKLKNKIQAWVLIWLNLAGKLVLIKSILASYPIFTCVIFLAPKFVINSLSIEIRKFLWQGKKAQGKKFNLVNWDIVMEDKYNGALGIRYPGLMNKALGSKLF